MATLNALTALIKRGNIPISQMEVKLRRRDPSAGYFADKYKTLYYCRLTDGDFSVREVYTTSKPYAQADWGWIRRESPGKFSLSSDHPGRDKATFKAASVADAEMWIEAFAKSGWCGIA